MTHAHERRDDAIPPLTQAEMKAALKDALKEWLDDKFAQFGVFSFNAIACAAIAAAAYFILRANGWHRGP